MQAAEAPPSCPPKAADECGGCSRCPAANDNEQCANAGDSCCGADPSALCGPGTLAGNLCNALCRTICEQGPIGPMAPARALAPKPPTPTLAVVAPVRPLWPRVATIAQARPATICPARVLSGPDRLRLHCIWLN
jgi:hypothetical protein